MMRGTVSLILISLVAIQPVPVLAQEPAPNPDLQRLLHDIPHEVARFTELHSSPISLSGMEQTTAQEAGDADRSRAKALAIPFGTEVMLTPAREPLRQEISMMSGGEMTGAVLRVARLLVVTLSVPLSPVAAADLENDEFLRSLSMTKPGAQLLVIDHAGAEMTGKLVDVRPFGLQLLLQGRAVEIPREEIAEVRRNGDSLWNGILLGGVFGTAVALDYISHVDCQTCSAWEAASVGLLLGGGGAALGGLLDYRRRDTRVLYRAVTREAVPVVTVQPMIKPRGWGLAFSWRF